MPRFTNRRRVLHRADQMFDLVAVQSSLKEFGLDGWLFYDFRGANVLARRVLGLDQKPVGSRRFFYFVPASGGPRKLVHRIETAALDSLPGEKSIYLRWQDLEAGVAGLRVVGPGKCKDTMLVREFLSKNFVPFLWYDSASPEGKKLMAVSVQNGNTFTTGPATVLFDLTFVTNSDFGIPLYDVSPDGQKFYFIQEDNKNNREARVNLILNWAEELKKTAPGYAGK